MDLPDGKEVFATDCAGVLASGISQNDMCPCDHEEADTRLIIHVQNALKNGANTCVVRTVDTDVLVILIGRFHHLLTLNKDADVWISFGTGKNFTYYSVNAICCAIGRERSIALPLFHSFTGCDITSCFHGRGKRMAWQAWNSYPEVTQAFTYMAMNSYANATKDDVCFKLLERFVVVLYDKTSNLDSVDEARKELFCQKGRSMENIPPTQDALFQHVKRAAYQGGIWTTSEMIMQHRPLPDGWGWTKDPDSQSWRPVWTILPIASKACREILNRFTKDIGEIDDYIPEEYQEFTNKGDKLNLTNYALNPQNISPAYIRMLDQIFGLGTSNIKLHTNTNKIRLEKGVRQGDSISPKLFTACLENVFIGLNWTSKGIPINGDRLTNLRFADDVVLFSESPQELQLMVEELRTARSKLGLEINLTLSSSSIGFIFTQLVHVSSAIQCIIKEGLDLQSRFTSVERVLEYGAIHSEGDRECAEEDTPPDNWPQKGSMSAYNVSLAYNKNNFVLKDICFSIKGGQKVGVVGRTGAGKTSLVNAIFRLEEPRGCLKIDGIDITKIGLHQLRKKISIIPQLASLPPTSAAAKKHSYRTYHTVQEWMGNTLPPIEWGWRSHDGTLAPVETDRPVAPESLLNMEPLLFMNTIRYNLDPFGSYSDAQLWSALESVELKSVVGNFPGKLDTKFSESNNLSVGEQQLICFARAILNKNKIIVLDEATSSVDVITDKIIQKTIRTMFKDFTVITIAHRINTIIDADVIMVIDNGNIVEMDSPTNLVQNKEGHFYKTILETGSSAPLLIEKASGGK
ncbi:Multiple drug resistance-associated protein-like transporter 1 [Nymphon striatum]|nr:Multiple drug resistance-associated protein-like transporter 1 [Nymphon striatum]